jgi:hypothetical protein
MFRYSTRSRNWSSVPGSFKGFSVQSIIHTGAEACYEMETRDLFPGKNGQGMRLTTDLDIVPRLRMLGTSLYITI